MKLLLRMSVVACVITLGACSSEIDDVHREAEDDAVGSNVAELTGANGISATLALTRIYYGGYCGRVTVTNGGAAPTQSWALSLEVGSERLTWTEGGSVQVNGSGVNVSSASDTGVLAVGGTAAFRFCATGSYRVPARLTGVSASYGSGGGGSGGSSGSGGSTGGGGAGTAGATGGADAGGGPIPQLPAITGTCPSFVTSTATVGGLSGISLQVGPRKQGTGSILFYWHGTGSSASEVNRLIPASVRQEILAGGGVIVSFQGSLGTGGDCSGTSTFSKDDFKVADLIAACAVRDHGIDPRRIYTTGCSAGGLQAGCMGAMRSSYVAAVVPNSGGEVTRQPIQTTQHVPAVMTMHGGSSDRVGVSFATTSATYDAHMSSAGSFVVNCNHGGGHCQAPSALYAAGWEFMKAHPFGVEPEPYDSELPASFPSYCAEY